MTEALSDATKRVNQLRKDGELDKALNLAKELYKFNSDDIWVLRSYRWALYSVIKREIKNNKISKAETLYKELDKLGIEQGDDIFKKSKAILKKMLSPVNSLLSKARALYKKGKFREEYDLLKEGFANYPDNEDLQTSYGWSIYRMIKDSESNQIPIHLFREYSKLIKIHKPGILHSFILAMANNYSEKWVQYTDFVEWWDLVNLTDDDWKRRISGKKNKKFPARAETTAKCLYKNMKHYCKKGKKYKWIYDFILEVESEFVDEWMVYKRAKIALWCDIENTDVLSKIMPLARKKSKDFWMWELLGELHETDDAKLKCFSKAILCKTQEEIFKIELYHIFAEYLIELNKDLDIASTLIKWNISLREAKDYKIPENISILRDQPWFNPNSEDDIESYCKENSKGVEELLFGDFEWYYGNYITMLPPKKNKPNLYKIFVKNIGVIRFKTLENKQLAFPKGSPVKIKTYLPDDDTKHILIFSELVSRDGYLFDSLNDHKAVVDQISKRKGFARLATGPTQNDFTLIHYNKFKSATSLKLGDVLLCKLEVNERKNRKYILSYEKCDKSSINGVYNQFSGKIEVVDGKKFGFVNDIFVPPNLVAKHNLKSGQRIEVWAVRQFNRKKNTLGWKALVLEKIYE